VNEGTLGKQTMAIGEQIGMQSPERTMRGKFTTMSLFVNEQTSATAATIMDPDAVCVSHVRYASERRRKSEVGWIIVDVMRACAFHNYFT
jgi:hypothetical protein